MISEVKSDPLSQQIRTASFNCKGQLARDDFLLDLLTYAEYEGLHILLLQETGLTNSHADFSPLLLQCYSIHINTTDVASTSTAVLVHETLHGQYDVEVFKPQGRIQCVNLLVGASKMKIFNLYLPTSLASCAPNSPQVQDAQTIVDLLMKTDPESLVLIGGDFNETTIPQERSTGQVGKYGCRFLAMLCGPSAFVDMSADYGTHTFEGPVFGRTISAKLDRFLCSPRLAPNMIQYRVDSNIPEQPPSDHRPIHIRLKVPKHNPVDSAPRFDVLRPEQFNALEKQQLWMTIQNKMKQLLQRLKALGSNILSSSSLSHFFALFSKIVTGTASNISHQRPKQPPKSRQVIRALQSERKSLRRMKAYCTQFKLLPPKLQWVRAKLQRLFPSITRIASLSAFLIPLRKQIRCVTKILNAHLDVSRLSSSSARNYFFRKRRRQYYDLHLRGRPREKGAIRTILDSVTNKIMTDPAEVVRVAEQEASKLFQRRIPPPKSPPAWFDDLYDPTNHVTTSEDWSHLEVKFSNDEIIKALQCVANKTPGHDTLTRSMLRFLCCKIDCQNTKMSHTDLRTPEIDLSPPPTLSCLAILLNGWFESGLCPDLCTKGTIIKIKKPGKRKSAKYLDKRPLTMPPEMAKLATKIIANRVQTTLHQNPHFLDNAQNGFLKEGGCDGPIRFLIERLQDTRSQKQDIFVVAYDQAKAYDSIQYWHVELALKRLSWPPHIIQFVLNYLTNSQSCVTTAFGKTGYFKLENSLRQGDPLSPLLYLLCIDPLHTFLRSQATVKGLGVVWGVPPYTERAVSIGFADDTLAINSSPEAAHRCHTIISTFFALHGLRLNYAKTQARYYINSKGTQFVLNSLDWGVGEQQNKWKGREVPFRYLGVHARCDLRPSSHLATYEQKCLVPYLHNLRRSRLPFHHCRRAVQEVIWNLLDYIGRFFTTPHDFVRK